jgi:hypothetical protein
LIELQSGWKRFLLTGKFKHKEKNTMDKKFKKEIKTKLLNRSNIEKVRFKSGEIHAYGKLPNSNIDGWFFIAYEQDIDIKGLHCID